jgi:Flp pilus assembly protein TadG
MSIYQLKRKGAASTSNKESQPARVRALAVPRRPGEFVQDSAGDVAIIFGLMATTLFMLIGGAVDLGRWLNARDHTMSAIDSAILAGGRTLQTRTPNQSTAQAQAAAVAMAQRYYNQAVTSRIPVKAGSDTVSFSVVDNGTALLASGNAEISTPFMSFAGIKTLPLLNKTGSDAQKAILAQDGNVEVAVMMDTSGSMNETTNSGNTKMFDMRLAVKDLVDIVVADDQSKWSSRVALVPFSNEVRLPAAWKNAIVAANAPTTVANTSSNNNAQPFQLITKTTQVCVGERTGLQKYTDAAPGVGAYVANIYNSSGNCAQTAAEEVVPLSNNKTMLKARVDAMDYRGGTAGQIGTAWAYYMLSDKWSAMSGAWAPQAKLKKFAVLMTDGQFNYVYDSLGRGVGDTTGANGAKSPTQAVALCTAMKADGILVYTIGFAVGSNSIAVNTLTACASDDPQNSGRKLFTNAADGNAVRAAFRSIGLEISKLRLSL